MNRIVLRSKLIDALLIVCAARREYVRGNFDMIVFDGISAAEGHLLDAIEKLGVNLQDAVREEELPF